MRFFLGSWIVTSVVLWVLMVDPITPSPRWRRDGSYLGALGIVALMLGAALAGAVLALARAAARGSLLVVVVALAATGCGEPAQPFGVSQAGSGGAAGGGGPGGEIAPPGAGGAAGGAPACAPAPADPAPLPNPSRPACPGSWPACLAGAAPAATFPCSAGGLDGTALYPCSGGAAGCLLASGAACVARCPDPDTWRSAGGYCAATAPSGGACAGRCRGTCSGGPTGPENGYRCAGLCVGLCFGRFDGACLAPAAAACSSDPSGDLPCDDPACLWPPVQNPLTPDGSAPSWCRL